MVVQITISGRRASRHAGVASFFDAGHQPVGWQNRVLHIVVLLAFLLYPPTLARATNALDRQHARMRLDNRSDKDEMNTRARRHQYVILFADGRSSFACAVAPLVVRGPRWSAHVI